MRDGGGLVTIGIGANRVAASVTECMFANDSVGSNGRGGGLCFFGDDLDSLVSTKVTGCTATIGGGVYVQASGAGNGFVMTASTISGNTATDGGGVFIFGTPDFHISGSSVTDNWAAGVGGGITADEAGGSILGTTVSGNAAGTDVGGIDQSGAGTVTLQVAKVHGNTAPSNPDVSGTFTFV